MKHQVIKDTQVFREGHCPKKHQCMQNPASANHHKGPGRQVSFTIENKCLLNYTV